MLRPGTLACFILAAVIPLPTPAAEKSPRLRVPEGFVIEKVAGEPDVVFPRFAVFDDRGRLFMAESSGLDLYAELQALTRKDQIQEMQRRATSLMLEGLERALTRQEFRDLLAFLQGLK
jgi:hypothetical protein